MFALDRAGLTIDIDLAPRTAVTYSSAIGGLLALQMARALRAKGETAP